MTVETPPNSVNATKFPNDPPPLDTVVCKLAPTVVDWNALTELDVKACVCVTTDVSPLGSTCVTGNTTNGAVDVPMLVVVAPEDTPVAVVYTSD